MTRLRIEQPHFRAMCRDGSAWALRMGQVDSFRDAWQAGRPFWSGFDVWDQPMDIKLADIVAVIVHTEASQLLGEEEAEEHRRRELTQ